MGKGSAANGGLARSLAQRVRSYSELSPQAKDGMTNELAGNFSHGLLA
jgi:hypothetical protein